MYAFAHQFYWDFRRVAEGARRWRFDAKKYKQLTQGLDSKLVIDDEDRARHQRIVDEEICTGRLEPSRRKVSIETSRILIAWFNACPASRRQPQRRRRRSWFRVKRMLSGSF